MSNKIEVVIKLKETEIKRGIELPARTMEGVLASIETCKNEVNFILTDLIDQQELRKSLFDTKRKKTRKWLNNPLCE